MGRRRSIAGSGLAALLLATACGPGDVGPSPGPARPPPNVVLIVADDLGYGDLAAYGDAEAETPHLDRLAAEGLRFTQAYVSAPLCAPARAGLLSGRDHNRYGYERTSTHWEDLESGVGVPRSEILLPELLGPAGYATGVFGKWHLGSAHSLQPLRRRVDTFFGFLGGAHDYFDWGGGIWGPILRGDEKATGDEYLTDAIAREAVAFVEAHGGVQPFFAYVAFNAIHGPLQAPERELERYASIADPAARALAAMISALDAAVGRILDALRRLDLERDTLVIFLSDNGASISSNAPLRGTKATLFEGGIRIPFLLRWPAALPGGVYEHPISSLDVLPTVAAAAGVAPPADRPLDGVDLLPYLSGARDAPPHEALYWRFQNAWAVRSGSMKLVHSRDHWNDETLHTGLFDLAVDVGERDDLSQAQPRLRRQLHQRLREWERSVVPVSPEAPR